MLQRLLEIEPSNPAVLDALGGVSSLRPDLPAARAYFERSLALNPAFEPARQNLGITLFALGKDAEAAQQFHLLEHSGEHARQVAKLFLGLMAAKVAQYAAADDYFGKAGRLVEEHPGALVAWADSLVHLGNSAAAVATLARFDALTGTADSDRKSAADVYRQLGMAARAHLETPDAHAGAADAEYRRAMHLLDERDLVQARALAQDMVEAHPTADAFLLLAEVAKQQEDFAVAMHSLQTAARLAPEREDAYLQFSEIAADHGNAELALETANIGLENVPASYRLKIQKGAVLDKLGRSAESIDVLREAANQEADNSLALLSLSVVLTHADKVVEAEHILTAAIARFPQNYYMHYFRGKLLLQLASGSEQAEALRAHALEEFRQSLRYNPSHADSHYQLSTLVTQPEQQEEALTQCLRYDPEHGPAQYALARLYTRTGRRAEGVAMLARYKAQQRAAELKQNKQLRIDVAHR